ncbi:MAG: thiol reductant ABC exporter subunit CydD [Anaerolineales bacterium]|jgi:ATP-binding cassette subfamily C protein CydCD
MKVTSRLLSLARDSRLALGFTILTGFLTGLLTIAQAAGLSRLLNGVLLLGQNLTNVGGLLQLLILIAFLRAFLAWGSEVSATAVALRIKNDLRVRLYDKILRLGPSYTRGERTGELVTAAIQGVETLDAYFSQYLPQLFIAAIVPLSILVVVFPRDLLSGLVLLLTAPLIPIFMVLIGKTAERLTKRQWDTLGLLSAHFLDSLQGLTVLKELGRSREQVNSISEAGNTFRDRTLGVLRITFLSALVLELVSSLSTAVVAVEVGLRLLYGQLAFQQAFFLLLLAPEFYLPLRMLGLRFHAGMSGATAAQRIFEILDAPLSDNNQPEPGDSDFKAISLSPSSMIAFEHLSYTYPGDTAPALQDISLEIRVGEHIALVGLSGAGKSTLAGLLLRFIQPESGQITINHEPLAEIPLDTWRTWVAWVPQVPYLFHDSIAANLRIALPDAPDGQLAAALQFAHLDEFVHTLPQGYGTVIGEEGARLSSGQAQRLALARAFLKNAPILILDEPTSSLDPEQETLVESALHRLMQGRTVITIAHRVNTIFNADRIFVLEQGRLVEAGSHSELLALQGYYTRLVNPYKQMVEVPTLSQSPVGGDEFVPSDNHGSITVLPPNPASRASFIRLLGFLKGSWSWVALSVLLGVLTVGSNVGLMGTSAFLISAAAFHPELGTLQVAIVGVRFFGIARGVFRYAERLTSHDVTFRLLARLRTWFFQALEPLAPARLMQYRAGDLLARIVADVESLENFYVRGIAPPLVAMVVAAGMAVIFGLVDLTLSWVYLGFMLLLGIGLPLLIWTLSSRSGIELVSRRAAMQARLVDGIQGLADILAFGQGNAYSRSLAEDGKACSQTQKKLGSLTGISNALTILLVNLGMLAVVAVAIPLIVTGHVSAVMLGVLSLSALAGFEAVIPLAPAVQTFPSNLQAARRLFEVVDAAPAVRDPLSVNQDSLLPTLNTDHELKISNLCFTYPGQPEPALQDITFRLPPGKKIAIVGPSGAGKSTLISLLLRFWDYSLGEILLDGHDFHEFVQEDIRRLFSVISQKSYFFNDTIRQNLLLARPTVTDAELSNAAQIAHIHDFIVGLPNGYETIIGERGFRLSGGERQRLTIARAFLKNAPIFLLDEPTANLDPFTEKQVLDPLFTDMRARSLLLITHRLVGLENMDEILVLDHGRIVENGSHANLLDLGGLYRRLWDFQSRFLSYGIEA